MKSKEFVLDNQLKFTVTKRRSSRHMRLSIANDGQVKVSIPLYLPYAAAISFVNSRKAWIDKNKRPVKVFTSNQPLGKSHHLVIKSDPNITQIKSKLIGTEAVILYPEGLTETSEEVQKAAKTLSFKALKSQAESLLPIRVQTLAAKYGFSYRELRFRNLKNRWGSCDHDQKITLNINLMELPWELIDYVIVHELNHTKHLNHGKEFWDNLKELLPNVPELKKELRKYRARP